MVKYYQTNQISQEYPFKFKTGLDKHVVHRNESWYVEKTDEEIINTFRREREIGIFFIRPAKGEQILENGLKHVFTLLFYLNKTNFEYQKFAIAKNEDSLWIMSQEFSSLIELVYYFKKNVLSNGRTLIEYNPSLQPKLSLNNLNVLKNDFFSSQNNTNLFLKLCSFSKPKIEKF